MREWLRDRRCRLLLAYLRNLTAQSIALAGNDLMGSRDQIAVEEAQGKIEVARAYEAALRVLEEMSQPTYEFRPAELLPEPLTVIEEPLATKPIAEIGGLTAPNQFF
jgi:hypothetical protein